MVQPVLEWRRGAMRRDLRVGTYAFGGATPGDQRVLAALGAGRRPAASLLYNSFTYFLFQFTGQETEPEVSCDFRSQKIWIFIWLILNVMGIIGLFVALGLFSDLGWWSMTYDPKGIHVPMFFVVLILLVLLIYGQLIVVTLYLLLKVRVHKISVL